MVRAAGAPVAPGRLDDLPDPTWRSILGRGLPQFAAEAVVPVLVFYGGVARRRARSGNRGGDDRLDRARRQS